MPGEFGRILVVRILRLAKTKPADMTPKRTGKVRLGIYLAQIQARKSGVIFSSTVIKYVKFPIVWPARPNNTSQQTAQKVPSERSYFEFYSEISDKKW